MKLPSCRPNSLRSQSMGKISVFEEWRFSAPYTHWGHTGPFHISSASSSKAPSSYHSFTPHSSSHLFFPSLLVLPSSFFFPLFTFFYMIFSFFFFSFSSFSLSSSPFAYSSKSPFCLLVTFLLFPFFLFLFPFVFVFLYFLPPFPSINCSCYSLLIWLILIFVLLLLPHQAQTVRRRAMGWKARVRFPAAARYFLFSTACRPHPASYPMGTWHSFPRCNAAGAWSRTLTST
jgi:hypothetical protein